MLPKISDLVEDLVHDLESNQLDDDLQSSSSSLVSPVPIFTAETNTTKPTLNPAEETEDMDSGEPFKFENISEPLTISFKGLNLFLKTNQQKLLTNISGVVKHHEITALMGPSGAGTHY
jgi:hypothetical protein